MPFQPCLIATTNPGPFEEPSDPDAYSVPRTLGDGDPTFTTRDPYAATLGIPIPANQRPLAQGAGGFYLGTGGDDHDVYVVTAQNAILLVIVVVKTWSSLAPPVSTRSSLPSTTILWAKSPRSPMPRRGSGRLRAWTTPCRSRSTRRSRICRSRRIG